jgi:hypothetical protein
MDINVFDVTRVGPALGSSKFSFGTNAFAVEATDGITLQKVKPLRPHELLAAYGFNKDKIKSLTRAEDTEWKEVFNWLKETSPVYYTWSPILLTAIHVAEVERAMELTTKLYQEEINMNKEDADRHCTNSKVLFAHA